MSTVYLLHFSERYPAGRRPQHYVGVARDVDKRVAEHRNGNPGKGGSLTRAIKAKGITFVVAEEWHFGTADDAFEFERKLKRQRHHARHCPVCKKRTVYKFEKKLEQQRRATRATRGSRRAAARKASKGLAELGESLRIAVAVGLSAQKRRRR